MAIYTIPLTPDPAQSMEVTLSGVPVRLTVRWMVTDPVLGVSGWYVDLYSQTGLEISLGRKLTEGTSVWLRERYNLSIPAGDLYVVDVSGKRREPGRDSFAENTHVLVWAER